MKAGGSRTGALWAAALVASILALALTGCGGGGGGAAGVASATGTVRSDSTLAPIANATVNIAGKSTTTGADGAFSLSNLPSGSRTIQVTVAGGEYETYNSIVNLAPAANNLGDIYLVPARTAGNGTVVGRIVDQNGQPVAEADIQIGLLSARSKSDGTFAVYNVPPMTYSLLVTKGDDMMATRSGAVVEADQTTDVGNIVLSSGPPPPPF